MKASLQKRLGYWLIVACVYAFLFLGQQASSATIPPSVNCGNLPGCIGYVPIPSANILVISTIPAIARTLLNIAGGLSILFVIIGGVMYTLNLGEEEKLTKAKNTIVAALGGLVLALSSHKIVNMVAMQGWGSPTGDYFTGQLFPIVASIILNVFNAAFLLMIVLGGMRFIIARGREEELTKARKMVFYAVVGALIVNIARLLVNIVLGLKLL
jgi:FtsH-binding integral membrane protein